MVNGALQVAQELNPKVIIRVLLLSHGHANVGVTDTELIAKEMAGLSTRGISTSAFGLCNGFDEDLMGAIASGGEGTLAFIDDPKQLSEQRLAGRDHHRFSNQNHTHHSSGEPLPEVGVITANGGRQLAVQNTPVPGLLGQAQHHPQQGVDNHDRKRGMDQPQPVNGLHRQRRIEERTGTASLCSGWPYHFRGAHAMVALNCSHQIRTDP